MTRSGWIVLLAVVTATGLLAVGAAHSYFSTRPQTPLLDWTNREIVERGKTLYASQCASCHGANGEGQVAAGLSAEPGPPAPPHDRTGHTWQHADFALIQFTKAGESTAACRKLEEGVMPKFEDALSDREILDVLSYIKSTWPADIIESQEKINEFFQSQNSTIRNALELDG